MITPEMRAEMRRLVLVERLPIETVARRFRVHHSTVRRSLADDAQSDAAPLSSALDPFKSYLVRRVTELPELTALRLFEEIKSRGYSRGIAQVRRYIAQVRSPRARKAYLRIDVEPGERAQVDWGLFGHRHHQPRLQGLGQALPQQRRRLRHCRPSRPQGPARPHHRQVPPLRPGSRVALLLLSSCPRRQPSRRGPA